MPASLRQWPVQIKLVPVKAPYFEGAKLLIAADCTAYAYGNFHQDFMRGQITLVGCPKLDGVDYARKADGDPPATTTFSSVTVVRMEVPCCGGLGAGGQDARCSKAESSFRGMWSPFLPMVEFWTNKETIPPLRYAAGFHLPFPVL